MGSPAETASALTLASPLELPSGTTLKNRLAKPAMSEQLGGPAGQPTPELERLYTR
ncbi:MAG: NADH:flavin oxidoreductase, partial [Solirubrobacterales bacterium]